MITWSGIYNNPLFFAEYDLNSETGYTPFGPDETEIIKAGLCAISLNDVCKIKFLKLAGIAPAHSGATTIKPSASYNLSEKVFQ